MRQEIWVVTDHDRDKVNDVTFEILGEARDLARHLDGKVCACKSSGKMGHNWDKS